MQNDCKVLPAVIYADMIPEENLVTTQKYSQINLSSNLLSTSSTDDWERHPKPLHN